MDSYKGKQKQNTRNEYGILEKSSISFPVSGLLRPIMDVIKQNPSIVFEYCGKNEGTELEMTFLGKNLEFRIC
jgi:hypothetical protein